MFTCVKFKKLNYLIDLYKLKLLSTNIYLNLTKMLNKMNTNIYLNY